MAKSEETGQEESTTWGTWEELLLACAVNRYGTKSWDSVAIEIRKRSSAPIAVTPHNCKSKYLDLKRRFRSAADSDATAGAGDTVVPWLDELRKVRVAELERELQRYDLSIVSLQMKVKRLTEESENGGVEKSDLQKCEEIVKNEEKKPELAPATCSPAWAQVVEKHESDGDNQSVNEWNENIQTGEIKLEENETKLVRTGEEGAEPESCSPVRENSCNDSSDSKPVLEVEVKVEPEGDVSESAELKDNSEVQSWVSKSKEGCDKLHCCSRKCDAGEGEGDQCPPALKGDQNQPGGGIVKSQPLVDLLQIVQSHKLASVFDRQLESQEKLMYSKLIRQHINVKILQTRLEERYYSEGNDSFFRDVLLLVNNALVFFSKKSPESVAAIELRQLILKEMAKTRRNKFTDSSDEKQLSIPPVTLPPKRAPELPDSLLLKPKILGPMIVCRKRSSITAKAPASTSGADRRKEQKAALAEETLVLDSKQPEKSSEKLRITKKRTRDSFPSVAKMKQKNVRSDTNTNKATEVGSNQNQGKGGSPGELSETKSEKKKKNSIESDLKKQGATNFLNRMKRSSTSSDGSLLNTFKSSVDDDSQNNIREEQKKGNNSGDERKDQTPKRSSGGRQMKEQGRPVKRNVGRPPKRTTAPLPMSAVMGKRGKEVGQVEAVAPKLPKKRSRK